MISSSTASFVIATSAPWEFHAEAELRSLTHSFLITHSITQCIEQLINSLRFVFTVKKELVFYAGKGEFSYKSQMMIFSFWGQHMPLVDWKKSIVSS